MRGVIMTIAERFYKVTKELPAPLLAELLDFAEFLRAQILSSSKI
jgi:hypothetical protein